MAIGSRPRRSKFEERLADRDFSRGLQLSSSHSHGTQRQAPNRLEVKQDSHDFLKVRPFKYQTLPVTGGSPVTLQVLGTEK